MKTIFTNGCFDVLHVGHVRLLEYCYELAFTDGPGQVIVGLNSDASVKRLKGDNRPINTEADRAYILQSLNFVHDVAIFDQDTPYELIKSLQPTVIVKGGDYKAEDVVGNDIAKVKIFDLVYGVSSTNVISKMNDLNVPSASKPAS